MSMMIEPVRRSCDEAGTSTQDNGLDRHGLLHDANVESTL